MPLAFVFTALAVAACTPAARESLTNQGARTAVRPVLLEILPTVPVEPAVSCVIANAAPGEILGLASEAATGPSASSRQIVGRILERPGTLACLTTAPIRIRR